MKICPDIALIV